MRMLVLLLLMPNIAMAGEKVVHLCGNGPHTVKVLVAYMNICKAGKLVLQFDDTYVEGKPECREEPKFEDQTWTDWPECPGAKRDDITSFIYEGNSSIMTVN